MKKPAVVRAAQVDGACCNAPPLMRGRHLPLLVVGFLIASGAACGSREEALLAPEPAPIEAHQVTCTDPLAQGDAWLSDGWIGVRFGRDGLAAGPAWSAFGYEQGGEEKLQPQPNPFRMNLTLNGKAFQPMAGRRYRQQFQFSPPRLLTSFESLYGTVSTWIELEPRARQEWQLVASKPGSLVVATEGPNALSITINEKAATSPVRIQAGDRVQVTLLGPPPASAIDRPSEPPAAIEIDGPVEDQQAINSFLAYLRMAVPASGQVVPISPNGLSSNLYKGHVFWDADVWVFPALAFLDPARAKVIPEYRLARLPAAINNGQRWLSERHMLLHPGETIPEHKLSNGAAKYPWESAISGSETMLGQFRHALHINGAVLWGLQKAAWLGMVPPQRVAAVEQAQAVLYRAVTERRADGRLSIRQVFGVDEFRLTDDDLITNLLAEWTLAGRRYPKDLKFSYPQRDGVFLTYEGDNQPTFKQAAAVLSIYPYQFPPAERIADPMMAFHARRTNPKGPAMTEAVHATIYARIGQVDEAYRQWKIAWGDFTAGRPLLLFSEHRNRDRTYFVTGAAGCLQTVLYGFAGFRIDYAPEPGALWSLRLREGGWLSIKPHLPKEWKRVTIRNFKVLGKRYTATITPNGVQVIEGDS